MCGLADVGGFFHISRHVARTHAERGFAAGIGRLYHGVAAGGEDGGHAGVFHQRGSAFHRGLFNPLHAVFRRAGGNGGIAHDLGGVCRTLLGGRVERENNRIAGFQGNQGFENGGRGGVGGGHDAAYHAYGVGDFGDAGDVVFADDTHGFQVAQTAHHVFAGKQVFGGFVFKHAAAGFFHGVHGQYAVFVERGNRGFGDDVVDLLLIEQAESVQRGQPFTDQAVDFGNRGAGGGIDRCIHSEYLQKIIKTRIEICENSVSGIATFGFDVSQGW